MGCGNPGDCGNFISLRYGSLDLRCQAQTKTPRKHVVSASFCYVIFFNISLKSFMIVGNRATMMNLLKMKAI